MFLDAIDKLNIKKRYKW